MLSLAMTTYNGAKYIEKQLDSIRCQTRCFDEVIICDDKSNDNTADIVHEYIEKWKLDNWVLFVNERNVGWIENFHSCISKTTGDIVFFCDQDDIWNLNKVKEMEEILVSNQNISVLSCCVSLIDSNDDSITGNKHVMPCITNSTGRISKNTVDSKFSYSIAPGCTMAVKRSLIDLLYGYYDAAIQLPHDALFWKIGSVLGGAYVYDKALINYRIHSNNASSPMIERSSKLQTKSKRINEALVFKRQIEVIMEICEYVGTRNASNKLNEIGDFCQARLELLRHKRSMMPFLVRYHAFYRDFRMLLGDLMSRAKK